MNITRENIDELNAIVKIDITPEDYQEKVTKILKDYRKKADIPGFRKGHVPIGMIRKQYGKPVMIEEVNKLLQEKLNEFLLKEKLNILGNPIPKEDEDFSWDAGEFNFEFELGLAPDFELDIKGENNIVKYEVEASEKLLDKEIENLQNRYGKTTVLEKAEKDSFVEGVFINEEKEINKEVSFLINNLKSEENKSKLTDAKVGDVIELKTKDLFKEEDMLGNILSISKDEANGLDILLNFTIEGINKKEKAELNQELFEKIFPDGSVKSTAELKERIKKDAEKQFQEQADRHFFNSVVKYFVENTKFDLPDKFLKKWLQIAGEKEMTKEEAEKEYENSEDGLRYQLIEEKIIKENNIVLDYTSLFNFTKELVRNQMAKFGNANIEDEELENIAQNVLKNKEEAQRLQQQLASEKMLNFYKENINFKTEKIDFEAFIERTLKSNTPL